MQVRAAAFWIFVFFVPAAAHGFPQAASSVPLGQQFPDLKRLSIEELTDLDVTTASRRQERLSEAAAAISVIRQEDIRRAGVSTIPDALRLAPGLHTAQVFGGGWAISARGFNISTANKLLVAIDGRTVYSPVFAGVFWEAQDVMLADVDRIEVIRGPGGSLWGANAVNGIINVITKPAAETQGGFVDAGAGTVDRGLAALRYGGKVRGAAYRIYGQFRAEDDRELVSGGSARDDLQFGQTGFRADSAPAKQLRWTVQGDLYSVRSGLADRDDTRMSGGNAVARLTRDFSPTSTFQLQTYWDRSYRRVPLQYRAVRNTFDVDTQQRLHLAQRHDLVFGAGARVSRGDDLGDGPGFFFDPVVRTSTLFSAFAQDEIAFRNDTVFLTAGTKLERNDFSGVELQPTVRGRWSPNKSHTLWGAVSRAVRMPTRFDTDLRIRIPGTTRLLITGSDDFQSENVVAVEGGYRTLPREWLSIDVAVYSNRYTDLRSQEFPLSPVDPFVLANTLRARTAGTETTAMLQLGPRWQVQTSYAYLWKKFAKDPGSRDFTDGSSEANDPSHVFLLRSSVNIGRRGEFDALMRYSSALPKPAVPAYAELNARFGWRFRAGLSVSVIGQNLIHERHEEFGAGTPREFLLRGMQLRVNWRF